MPILNPSYNDLQLAKELVYDRCNFDFANLQFTAESSEYAACTFQLEYKRIIYRIAKITPTKNGQFVTIWKRNKEGITAPFDLSDELDFIIISARSGDHFGQFIFPKQVLADKAIITQNGKIGKRGIRVYPPWDFPESKQAQKTQNWQLAYFLTITTENSADIDLAHKLLNTDP